MRKKKAGEELLAASTRENAGEKANSPLFYSDQYYNCSIFSHGIRAIIHISWSKSPSFRREKGVFSIIPGINPDFLAYYSLVSQSIPALVAADSVLSRVSKGGSNDSMIHLDWLHGMYRAS